MSDFFCECKDSGEPPCAGLVQLRADLAARDAELAEAQSILTALEDHHCESDGCAIGDDAHFKVAQKYRVKFHEMKQRAEAAERERDAAGIELQRHKAGFPGGWTEELQRQIEFRHNAERERDEWKKEAEDARAMSMDVSEWKRKAEEAARDSARLDWLDATGHKDGHGFCHLAYGDYRHYAHASYGGVVHKSARETIDAAIAAKGD